MKALGELALVCGFGILLPALTFSLGFWAILHFVGRDHRFAMPLYALLLGTVAGEATFFGLLIDPRHDALGAEARVAIALCVAAATAVTVVLGSTLFTSVTRLLRR